MLRQLKAIVALTGIVLAVAAAVAQGEDAAPRDWSTQQIEQGRTVHVADVGLASTAPGQSIFTYRGAQGAAISATVRSPGSPVFQPTQILDTHYAYYPVLDASFGGGAVLAWIYHRQSDQELRIATLEPGSSLFRFSAAFQSTDSDYSLGRPQVAVGADGTAAVLYLGAGSGDDEQRLMAVVREADGTWGVPEQLGSQQPRNAIFARDVEIGPDGTIAAGIVSGGRAAVVVREPGGQWTAPETLGRHLSSRTPQVGIDEDGVVAAAWLEDDGSDETGEVEIAYRPRGEQFGDSHIPGMRAWSHASVELGVSAGGEVIVVADTSRDLAGGGTQLLGVHAVYGNATRQVVGEPAQLNRTWDGTPVLGMNARGDAVVLWGECCPTQVFARRRPPNGSFTPAVEIEPGSFENSMHALGAHADAYGNAQAALVQFNGPPVAYFVAADEPVVDQAPAPPGEPGPGLPEVVTDPPAPEPPFDEPDFESPPSSDPPGPPGPPSGLAPDRVAPNLMISVQRRLVGARRRWVAIEARCDEACQLGLQVTVRKHVALATMNVELDAARVRRVLVPWTSAARQQTRGRRSSRLRLSAVAIDAASNARSVSTRSRLLLGRVD